MIISGKLFIYTCFTDFEEFMLLAGLPRVCVECMILILVFNLMMMLLLVVMFVVVVPMMIMVIF